MFSGKISENTAGSLIYQTGMFSKIFFYDIDSTNFVTAAAISSDCLSASSREVPTTP